MVIQGGVVLTQPLLCSFDGGVELIDGLGSSKGALGGVNLDILMELVYDAFDVILGRTSLFALEG